MVFGWLVRLARVRVTVVYAVIVTCVSAVLLELGPQVQDRVIRHTSTNLHNLSHGHWATLLGSAFVIDAGPIYVWLPGLVCLLAVAELTWRSGRFVVAFVVGHVGATLLVAAGLTAAVELGWLSGTAITRATDVGMSYGAAAVLGSLTAAIPRRWRSAWIGGWLAVGVAVVALGRDFTDAGHAVALVLGMLVSTRFGRPPVWTPRRLLLLGVGTAFGYLVLASSSIVIATASGLLGAAFGEMVARRRAAASRVDVGEGEQRSLVDAHRSPLIAKFVCSLSAEGSSHDVTGLAVRREDEVCVGADGRGVESQYCVVIGTGASERGIGRPL
jgi:hypothetical protein